MKSKSLSAGKSRITKHNFFEIFGVPIALVVIWIFMSSATKSFATTENIFNILRSISIISIAAIGSTFIFISGGMDISVSAIMAMGGVISVSLMVDYNMPMIAALLVAAVAGALVGTANGLIITYIKLPPFIATLGVMNIVRGCCFIYTGGYSIYGSNLPEAFKMMGRGYVGVIPVAVILMIVLYVIFYIVLNKTTFGVKVYAIGSNDKASRLFGINVNRTRVMVYMIGGLTAALAGILLASRLQSAQAGAADGMEFDVFTAVVLGGISIYGGKGRLERALLGALMIGVINNGMTLMNVSSFYQMVVSGAILILALALDRVNFKQ